MATLPNPNPSPYLGIDIHCSWPSACFFPGAVRHWGDEIYEAWVTPPGALPSESPSLSTSNGDVHLTARTLKEMHGLIRDALRPSA